MADESELLAVVRYLEDLEWRAEDAHYQTMGNDHPENGRVYASRDLMRELRRTLDEGGSATREAILSRVAVHLAAAEAEYANTPNATERAVEGRLGVLLEIRATLRQGRHAQESHAARA